MRYLYLPSSFQFFSCPYFFSRHPIGKGMVFDRIGRIKALDPRNDQNIKDVIWVHKHRYPVDGEGVSTYYGMGANWMLSGPNYGYHCLVVFLVS